MGTHDQRVLWEAEGESDAGGEGYKMTTRRKLTRRFDQVWGVDRYRNSPYYGQVVTETVHLWNEAGAKMLAENMTGALAHGAFVRVLAKREVDGHIWYKCHARVEHEGKVYIQRGWLVDRMLRKRGKGAFE